MARKPTFGEQAVGLTFNPSGDPVVLKIKKKAAGFIDACDKLRRDAQKASHNDNAHNSEVIRMASLAITKAQEAQMWAVKAATWEPK